MTLLVLGINHETASVAVREKVAFSEEKAAACLTTNSPTRFGRKVRLFFLPVTVQRFIFTIVKFHPKSVNNGKRTV